MEAFTDGAIRLSPGTLYRTIQRLLRALLFGVPTIDLVTILLTLVVCGGMSLTGAWVPARRAIRVSPMSVMRAE